MEFRNLGRSGLRVSVLGLGCNNFGVRLDLDGTRKVVHKALDLGITLFDTADIYGERGGSETQLGQILGDRRKDIVLATKFGMPMDEAGVLKGGARRYIMQAVEASLKRLRTDWIDLYQIHCFDPFTPIEETLRALDDLVRSGKVRYIGCSNFAAWQVVEAAWTARHHNLNAFVSVQDELSLVVRRNEEALMPAVEAYGLGFLPYFPLACGLLSGKYRKDQPIPEGRLNVPRYADRYLNERNWMMVEEFTRFAEQNGKDLLTLAFSWLLARKPVASVIAGATSPEQLEANAKAAGWALTAEHLSAVDRITNAHQS